METEHVRRGESGRVLPRGSGAVPKEQHCLPAVRAGAAIQPRFPRQHVCVEGERGIRELSKQPSCLPKLGTPPAASERGAVEDKDGSKAAEKQPLYVPAVRTVNCTRETRRQIFLPTAGLRQPSELRVGLEQQRTRTSLASCVSGRNGAAHFAFV